MRIQYALGAILIIFILCVHCHNEENYNEVKNIYLPSAPQNLTANRVSADEIHLSWAPPTTFTLHPPRHTSESKPDRPINSPGEKRNSDLIVPKNDKLQADDPRNYVIETVTKPENILLNPAGKNTEYQSPLRDWYNNDKKYDDYSSSDMLSDSNRSKRDVKFGHRHRKRRQEVLPHANESTINDPETVLPKEVVKKSSPFVPHKGATQIAYVLYYEQGVPRTDSEVVRGIPSSAEVKNMSVFSSDLGMDDYSKSTKNLTLLNAAGVPAKVVGYRLRNLKTFTPYKIWVRAFYNFSLEGVKSSDLLERLGPQSEPLYVMTDVRAPSAPIVLNLTCDQSSGIMYLQWRQPVAFDNSLDHYIVTLRKVPELQPRTRLTLPTNKNDIETTISLVMTEYQRCGQPTRSNMLSQRLFTRHMPYNYYYFYTTSDFDYCRPVELWNVTLYEVKIYAVTRSVARPQAFINGSESGPEQVSSEVCSAIAAPQNEALPAALLATVPIALLAIALLAAVYCRCRSRLSKCISAAYSYLEEGGERNARAPLNSFKKPVSSPPLAAAAAIPSPPAAARPPRMAGALRPALSARAFVKHVAALHADSDVGFSKEYEIVVAQSAALGHTSHYSHRPENRLKNRYLNITAYDHSRVCVSSGGRCGAQGCVGGGESRGSPCDYVNANFIDGMLPALDEERVKYIKKKLERRNKPQRQPSVKTAKPPPNLAEGIESAFLNIEFSGIVEPEGQDDDSSSEGDDDPTLDDVYVDIDGEPTQVKLEWLLWKRRYIATQGPTPATLDAFWRMIWQHEVRTIVMITNLVERGRRKCDMYWPHGGRGSSALFGSIHVTLIHEDVRAAYTVRWLSVRDQPKGLEQSMCEEARVITQYHYTVWPDHGTPRHPLAVLPFVQAAADTRTVLVHCSAGVGRTGTYIVLDAQLSQFKLTGSLSPLGFLCRARTQRNHLVQTEEQYIFVHDALLEHVRSGNTEVEFSKAREYLVKLLQPISEDELAVLDLNSNKNKSLNDLTNGFENAETSSLKSSQINDSDNKNELPNGDGSQISIKTDEISDPSKSVSVRDLNGDENASQEDREEREGMVNGGGGEETEVGVYDLAPRSTDTYSKKMQAYNNLSEQEKEEIRRANRAENYAILERMRSLSSRTQQYQGPPPCNLLEKQFLSIRKSFVMRTFEIEESDMHSTKPHSLITRSCVEPAICAKAAHNLEKNRPGGALPSDAARVMLVPKPGVEGSEYVNASWVCGRRRLREYAVTQAPREGAAASLWRLLWDHTAQLVLQLAGKECEAFWPTEDEKELFVANFRASFVSKDTYIAHRKCDRNSPETTSEPETNGHRRTESSECADDERLIPDNSPITDTEPAYKFDRTELRLERLSAGNKDLSARKSIANGDLFSSLSENRKSGPKSPRSPSKMSLKNFKLSSPTKFKFPDWGSRACGSPPDTAPPPPPVAPPLTVEEESELRRPCYYFEKVETIPENIPSDRVIEVTNVSVHSLQDDYQLSVKFIRCDGWLEGDTTDYVAGRPDDNEFVRAIREASSDDAKTEALDRLTEDYKDSFALIEFVAGCQMEYKNGPVVVVDKYGDWKAMCFCTLSASCGGARVSTPAGPRGADDAADVYRCAALSAHARCGTPTSSPHTLTALLKMYAALARYGHLLCQR